MGQKRIMKIILWGGILFILVGAVFGARSLIAIANGSFADGQVIELIKNDGDDRVTYTPKVIFADSTGQQYIFTSFVSHSPSPYKVGDRIKVVYDPKQPTSADIYSYADLGMIPGMFIESGLFAAIISLLGLRYINKKEAQQGKTTLS